MTSIYIWNGIEIDAALLPGYGFNEIISDGSGGTSARFLAFMNAAIEETAGVVTGSALGLIATSSTSMTIGTGPQTLTVNAGKQFAAGMFIDAYSTVSPNDYAIGQVTSYDPGTGVLEFTVFSGDTGGSGTFSAWTVVQSGRKGSTGLAATITVGTVTTGAPGSSATVVNSGTSGAAVFDISIPRGDIGPTGAGSTVFTAVNGVAIGTARPTLNFVTTASSGINISVVDNPGANRTDITVITEFLSPKNHFLMSRN
jgi:hypothetical protein